MGIAGKTKLRRTLLLAAVAATVWSLGYGPLMPWSPFRAGFREVSGRRVTLVYPEGWAVPRELREPDRLLEEAERFHRLRAGRAVTVTVLRDWGTAYRVLPRLARKGIGAITLATGTAIYVLPTVEERGRDPVEFVRHELSHAVLHQNQGLLEAMRIVEVQWLAEGIAVWFGRQKAYGSDEEFVQQAGRRDLRAYLDPALRERLGEPFDIRFGYLCWKRFNLYLEGQDAGRYWGYVHATIARPREWRELFAQRFGRSFESAVSAFAQQMEQESGALR